MPKTTIPATETTQPVEREPNTLIFEDREHTYGFVILPKIILHAANLSSEAKLLYAYLLGYAYEKDRCFPGYIALCADMQKSENTVRSFMRELEAAQLLEQKRRGLGKTNIYVMLNPAKARLQLQTHHQQPRTSESEVLEPQKTTLLEPQNFRSNKEEIEQEESKEIYPSKIRKTDSQKKKRYQSH